jgi:hypothetical protein
MDDYAGLNEDEAAVLFNLEQALGRSQDIPIADRHAFAKALELASRLIYEAAQKRRGS